MLKPQPPTPNSHRPSQPTLVQPLEAASVVLSSVPRIFDTAGPLRIPKLVPPAPVSGSSPKAG